MRGSSTPAGSRIEQAAEILYESATTRVIRSGGIVRKEPLEADAGARLRHEREMILRLAGIEGVVQLASAGDSAGALCLRDCGGVALAQVLRSGPCEISTVVSLAPQLARILAEVHGAGVIHRDVNPANILLSSSGKPELIDFDLAVPSERQFAVLQDGEIVGTFAYLAPEQSGRTARPVDQRADLYALGATLYEMATGRLPFESQDTLQLIHDHLAREPEAPSQVDPRVPRGLSRIILRLLAKEPEQRYQSAEGLLYDLERLRSDLEERGGGDFELGLRDFPARLPSPVRLVGRETELGLLRSTFAGALHGPHRALLVEGAPGAGKSMLLGELKPLAATAGGWFVYGKFDQYQRDSATGGAVVHALRALGRLLLAEPKETLALHRRRILQRLGRSAGLIAQLPEFGLLLGAQPALAAVDPAQAEERLRRAILDLLWAVASPARPLVIVLDDLHWASARSLRAFEGVMAEPGLLGVLIVGAYRGDEVDADHVLSSMLARWRRRGDPPQEMAVRNLERAGVRELVGQMLRLSPQRADDLAQAVASLTGGNPFDTVEMLNALRVDGLLRVGRRDWQWDAAAIRRFVGRGNVVDLLSARIARLPPASRALLECMSCLGGSVERKLLQVAGGLDAEQLEEQLRSPLEDGLLVSDDEANGHVQFRHDRVQQAVLAGLPDQRRDALQLAMARRLARQAAFRQHMTQQYLGCAHLVTDAAEQRFVAEQFHSLAVRLAEAANYALAENYLTAASKLYAALDDPADASVRDEVEAGRHAALYSLWRLEEADAVYEQIQDRLDDPIAMAESGCVQIRSLEWRARSADGVALGIALLARLGLSPPDTYGGPEAERRLDAMRDWALRDKPADLHSRAELADPRALAASMLLGRLGRSAYVVDKGGVAAWMMYESQRLWAEHGPCGALVLGLCRLSAIFIGARQDYRTGYAAARHVLAAGEARGFEPDIFEARIVFAINASPWFEPLERAIEHVLHAREGMQGRDTLYVCYSYRATIPAMLDCAETLESLGPEVEASQALAERTGNHHAAIVNVTERQLLHSLRGSSQALGRFGEQAADEDAWLARTVRLPMARYNYHLRKCLVFALRGDVAELATHSAAAMGLLGAIPGYYTMCHAYLFKALAHAWQIQASSRAGSHDTADVAASRAELEDCRAWLAARAVDQPDNFLHLACLVEAEQAWASGDAWKAATTFEAAMAQVHQRRRPWHRALITERAAHFHLAQGLEHSGRLLLTQARDLYAAWGASAKVELMQQDHAWMPPLPSAQPVHSVRASQRGAVTTDALDLVGVLRASQALSSETSMERLAARVTEVLAALSGATRVLVLSCNDDQWWLLAPAPNQHAIPVPQAAERGLLPLSAFAYAERTGETLVVDDACADDRFARDPYLEGVPHCSLLAVPIAGQGTRRAMLLLENRQGRAAFNAQRLDAVMLIAGQLAVSLANAQLYESLEQRVQARTRELQETQAQLVATARRAGMAEIANNVLHNVGNVLNSINVSAGIMRSTIANFRIDGLKRALAMLNDHERDLTRFLSEDERGRTLLAYLTELSAALGEEQKEALGDLDRLVRSVDHVSYVVATQQSHAGPSSVLETVQPHELLEEALRLSAQAIDRHGAIIDRRYEDVPATALDKPRLLQIMVNLIANAAQAMEGVPPASRLLTLGSALVGDDSGKRLRITVRDQGEGIAPDDVKRLFAHGFTTRKDGHGFGLHSSALAAMEMGAKLTAHSDGLGRGAVFTLELPVG